MASYKNGIETKKMLLQSCQKLFYEKGYLNTTVKDIVTDANSKLGLFSYYFKGKEEVARDIYQEFVNQIPEKLKESMGDCYPDDFLLIDMIEFRAFFLCIHVNSEISRFYLDLTYTNSFMQLTIDIAQYFVHRLMTQYNTDYINTLLWRQIYRQSIISMTSGMQVQFFRDLMQKKLELDYEDGIDLYMEEYYRFLIKDRSLIKKTLRKSRHLLQNYQCRVLPNFQVIIEEK